MSHLIPFFFNDTAPSEIYTLSLHDALPILEIIRWADPHSNMADVDRSRLAPHNYASDRKSTRLNSSHITISYAVFCLKKKKKQNSMLCIGFHRIYLFAVR